MFFIFLCTIKCDYLDKDPSFVATKAEISNNVEHPTVDWCGQFTVTQWLELLLRQLRAAIHLSSLSFSRSLAVHFNIVYMQCIEHTTIKPCVRAVRPFFQASSFGRGYWWRLRSPFLAVLVHCTTHCGVHTMWLTGWLQAIDEHTTQDETDCRNHFVLGARARAFIVYNIKSARKKRWNEI